MLKALMKRFECLWALSIAKSGLNPDVESDVPIKRLYAFQVALSMKLKSDQGIVF
jgi:hypothetical protein